MYVLFYLFITDSCFSHGSLVSHGQFKESHQQLLFNVQKKKKEIEKEEEMEKEKEKEKKKKTYANKIYKILVLKETYLSLKVWLKESYI